MEKMRKTFPILLMAIIALITVSCADKKTKDFFHGHYSLPGVLLKVQDNEAIFERVPDNKAYFVVWFSQNDCSECAVSHLQEKFGYLWRLQADTKGFQTIYVMSPKEDEIEGIVEMIKEHEFPWPVFIDVNNECPESLPEDPVFHFFLMDKNGKPVWTGSPVHEGVIDKQFLESIKFL